MQRLGQQGVSVEALIGTTGVSVEALTETTGVSIEALTGTTGVGMVFFVPLVSLVSVSLFQERYAGSWNHNSKCSRRPVKRLTGLEFFYFMK